MFSIKAGDLELSGEERREFMIEICDEDLVLWEEK